MYTECPECHTTFRLTAQILRQAQGRVRCGGCGSTFNALDNLSEEVPGPDESDTQVARRFDEESRELLETLDELSGEEELRIEDTGSEWQVVDDGEDGAASGDDEDREARTTSRTAARAGRVGRASQGALDLGPEEGDAELRFDDNTPLPDDFYSAQAPRPRRRASDAPAEPRPGPPAGAEQTTQVDLEFSDVDWQDLLAEVEAGDAGPDAKEPGGADAAADADVATPVAEETASPVAGAEPQAEPDADGGRPDRATGLAEAADADAASQERVADEPGSAGAAEPESADAERLASADDERTAEYIVDEAPTEQDDEPLSAAGAGPWYEDPTLVETIVMEGDSFSDTLSAADEEDESDPADHGTDAAAQAAPEFDDSQLAAAGASRAPAMSPRQRYAAIAAIVLLGLLLAGQVVHANRESLATLGVFESTLAPLYAALGNPVTPAWDIRGWQFESTTGSTDVSGSRLTIYSRIANRSDGALPYPLVHVSLTDRFDDVIGSRLLEPGEYLAGNGSEDRPVAAGDDFTAVITVDSPSPDATGFKLNVCYPVSAGQVRCAIENFRD